MIISASISAYWCAKNFPDLPKPLCISSRISSAPYSLQILDKNNKYSFGHLSPYQSSEWFEIRSDTISIRSNWDMEVANKR